LLVVVFVLVVLLFAWQPIYSIKLELLWEDKKESFIVVHRFKRSALLGHKKICGFIKCL
jgi:hypothetical protein